MVKRDTYFCPICHATIDGRSAFETHKEAHKSAPVAIAATVAPVMAPAEIVATSSRDEISAMMKPELVEMARKMGIEKIDGKYLSQCKAADIVAEIISKKGE